MKRKHRAMNRAIIFCFLSTLAISSTGCSTVRESKPLAYAGADGRSTVASLEASIRKRGYKPICEERAFCKFQYGSSVWIHYKTSASKVVMAVDVKNGTEMPVDKRKALTAEAETVGEEIWREASVDAQEHEKADAEKARADAAQKKADEERAAAEKKKAEATVASNGGSSGGGVTGFLNAASGVLGGITKVQSNTSTTCCLNGAYYQCQTPSALNKCAGEFSACVTKCALGSDMSCPDKCLKDHAPDPSGCNRQPEHDAECPANR